MAGENAQLSRSRWGMCVFVLEEVDDWSGFAAVADADMDSINHSAGRSVVTVTACRSHRERSVVGLVMRNSYLPSPCCKPPPPCKATGHLTNSYWTFQWTPLSAQLRPCNHPQISAASLLSFETSRDSYHPNHGLSLKLFPSRGHSGP
jgi:hypothetical protein